MDMENGGEKKGKGEKKKRVWWNHREGKPVAERVRMPSPMRMAF